MRFGLRHFVLFAVIGSGICSAFGCSSRDHGRADAGIRRHREHRAPKPDPVNDEPDGSAVASDGDIISARSDGGTTEADAGRDAAESGMSSGDVPQDASVPPISDAGVSSGEPDVDAAVSSEPPKPPVADPGIVIPEPNDEARYVFDQTIVRTYNIIISESDLAMIDLAPAAEVYVNGMLEFEGKAYGPLAVRYKGSVGGFLAPCTAAASVGAKPGPKTGKCSMKIDFDRIDPTARFHGLKKLNFHSMDRDPSMMRDRLGYSLFREFGVVAPRASHAQLLINGKLEGLYVVVEQIDGRFTHSRFSEGGDGNLYKEVWPVSDSPTPYLAALETNEERNPSVDKMLRFEADIDHGAAMQWLDSDYTFRYIAADRVMINDDGAFHWYCAWNHNYYWYEAEHADRMWIIPWDMDSSFQNGTFVHITTPWNAPAAQCTCARGQMAASCDRLTSEWAMLEADYERAVDAFLTGPFAASNVNTKLSTWSAQIDSFVNEASGLNGAPVYADWRTAFANLQAVIESARTHRGYAYTAAPPMP
jgi:hypothetical protein